MLSLGKAKYSELLGKLETNYTREEFNAVIALLSHSKLVDPIKKHIKDFQIFIAGFRPDNLPLKKLQDIYYTRIIKNKDQLLAVNYELQVNAYMKQINKDIEEKVAPPAEIHQKIKKNDSEYLDKLIDFLVDTKLQANAALYFKLMEWELTEEQTKYIKGEIQRKLEFKKVEEKVKNELSSEYMKKLNEEEKGFREIEASYKDREISLKAKIIEKDCEIDSLRQKLNDKEFYYKFELANKDVIIEELKRSQDKAKNKHNVDIEKLNTEIENLKLTYEDLVKINAEKDEIIISLTNLLELKQSEFDEVAIKNWRKNNQDILIEKAAIEETISSLNTNKEEIHKEIASLNAEKMELDNKIAFIKNGAGEFVNNIQEVLDIIGFGRSLDIIPSVGQASVNQDEISRGRFEQSKLHIILPEVDEQSIKLFEETDDKSYFIDDLKENLEGAGISNEFSFDLAQYIYATFASKMSLLLIGFNARKVSEALSYIVSGFSADIITLPLGYNDSKELISAVNSSRSRVVLIENAVENISESVYLPLIKQNIDKLIIFSMESSENIGIVSKSIYDYMMPVDLDTLLGLESGFELLKSVINEDIFKLDVNINSKSKNLRQLKGIDRLIKLSNASKFKIAEVMSIIDELGSTNAMYDNILCFIYMFSRANGKLEELKEFIEAQELKSVNLKILQSVLGDDLSG